MPRPVISILRDSFNKNVRVKAGDLNLYTQFKKDFSAKAVDLSHQTQIE